MAMKRCHTCKKTKSVNNFYKNKYHKDGLASACKPCASKYSKEYWKKNKSKLDEYNKQWKKKNTDINYNRRVALKHKYNITLEQYDRMFESQNGVCAICDLADVTGRRLAVDHNHKTGKVRSLLCYKCNTRLGVIEDKDFMDKAKQYLKGHSN